MTLSEDEQTGGMGADHTTKHSVKGFCELFHNMNTSGHHSHVQRLAHGV